MRKINAVPNVEVAGAKFGQKRCEVRSILGEYKEFRKNRFSKNTSDDFGYCHAYYNSNDELDAIEFFDDVAIYICNEMIFPIDTDIVKNKINDLLTTEDSMISRSQSLGFSVSEGKATSLLLAKRGYYD